jgi:hypothetical protein
VRPRLPDKRLLTCIARNRTPRSSIRNFTQLTILNFTNPSIELGYGVRLQKFSIAKREGRPWIVKYLHDICLCTGLYT